MTGSPTLAPTEDTLSVKHKTTAHALAPAEDLFDVDQKTPAHERYIAPRPREGNPYSSAASHVVIYPKKVVLLMRFVLPNNPTMLA